MENANLYLGKYGSACTFSHDRVSSKSQDCRPAQRDRRADESLEEQRARVSYNSWRRLIRRLPQTDDLYAMQNLWDGALEILNGDDRDWKQTLPKDLNNDDDYCGRDYIQALLSKRAQASQYDRFIKTSRSFLLVMTHSAMVDCLSVDTYVGSLYIFMSGANGTRAIPFFQHICEIIVATRTETVRETPLDRLDSTLVVLSAALSELLRREPRARYNENLSDLINSLETAAQLMTEDESTVTSNIIISRARDLRAVVDRACGLLSEEADNDLDAPSTSVLRSTYPRDIVMPGDRHDNDKIDITKIKIFPTRGEIMSDVKEFLPSTDPDQPHFLTSKLERHIDTHFRLLRHDTFGKLKDSLGGLMKDIINDPNKLTNPRPEFGDTRTYTYSNPFVSYLMLNSRGGLQARISFLQPHPARRGSTVDRRKCTETRNDDSLTHSNNTATITVKLMTHDQAAVEALLDLSRQKIRGILLEFPHILPATFIPVLENLQNMQRLSRLPFREWILPDRVGGPSGAKLDVPPPLYARHAGFAFPLKSILISGASTMSLCPSFSGNDHFSLAELEEKTELDRGQCVALVAALTREFAFIQGPPGTGKSYLGVKLMKVLLDVKTSANLGPIVVVCYTNHALDQFLEHLINTGIRKIIRVGGQSRSDLLENHNLRIIAQSEAKSKHESWQAATGYQKLNGYEEKSKRILGRLHGKPKRIEWKYFERHIAGHYDRINAQFKTVDEDGFTIFGRHPFDIWADVPSVAEPGTAFTTLDMASIIQKAGTNVQSLAYNERGMLIKLWTEEIRRDAAEEFFEIIKDAEATQRHLTNVHEEINRRVLQGADVIGLTTSGLAKNISTLQRVRSKVVICEEAGEVMEPHIISALLPTVEHFVQIGDHQQLRPSINNFHDLSLESDQGVLYQLDRSQFERLSVGERGRPSMPVAQLNVQRRMRPDVSTLIRETIYDKLIDHPSTAQLPDVVGMRKNVFWLDHDNMEDEKLAEIQHKKSKSNDWEVDMVHALVRHMVRQGVYTSSDIAVLTPYTGQLQKLRTAMRNDFEIILSDRDEDALIKDGFTAQDSSENETAAEQHNKRKPLEKKKLSDLLRVATVDNFQGEEAKIIIVSLVRSNKNQKVGFLKTTNRINVLLSRAQHGMYLIGNTDTYSNIPMWQKVINMLRAKNSVGPSLDLCCPRHMATAIQVQQPDDFAKLSPEGGCREACMDRLPDCGHRCQARCHSKAMHEVFSCEQPCQRRYKPCDHPCQKKTCGEDCGRCTVALENIQLPCGHFKERVFCYLAQNLNAIQCNVVVSKTVPRCGHIVQVQCSQEVNEEKYLCPDPCGTILTCGHPCPGSCGRCNIKDSLIAEHSKCDRICGRRFGTCNHTCPKTCHDGSDCGLCMSRCEVTCKHSRCTLRCHEACAPCIERCTWSCPHQGECTMPCSAPCNRFPCNKRCSRQLLCGHQCPGICGEDCLPEYCKECRMQLDAQVDMLLFMQYGEINLDETPVIALACGHFFTAETLDGMIGLKEVYKIDPETSNVLGLEDISSTMALAIPKCPHCQRPIRQYATQRYNRLINRAVIDEMSKRFIVTGQTDLQEMESKLTKIETELEDTRSDVTGASIGYISPNAHDRAIRNVSQKLQIRYRTSAQLRAAVSQLQRRVAERHQPAHKLHEATVHAMQRDLPLESALGALKLKDITPTGERDHRITLGAKMIEIKIDCITMEDKFRVLSAAKAKYGDSATSLTFSGNSPLMLIKGFFQSCEDLINKCSEKALPKLAVEASLYYARIVRLFETSGLSDPKDREMAIKHHESAKTLLEGAEKLCEQGFQAADTLLQAVRESLKSLQKDWYEEVTVEEVEAIKKAMVSGPRGIATHSGHWYNCANGHPFAIGECGMPMELARCPECGARIGGQHHEAVQGVTRAENMEH
ncbi:NFX1-type zinc finger-containing protein 1 [Talaromyces proteolyticus]|uniref:NFX1-type zinc finger-containing protein 1 n=1 Tax=Talaromyces proteolyticus TaxID=1131652 RepID=A0AAD4KDV4_9EURO|nr:NFX1-type zinc finger-containing protein 1 [Talaromyces proteolyticus]KAH8689897.1 NFX1-type zinc finger-containing protein 1 [Talaromyces proteolyticus]